MGEKPDRQHHLRIGNDSDTKFYEGGKEMKVNIEIPEAENFSSIWEPEFKISTSVFSSPKEGQSIAIHANAEGLISLARLFLFLAQPAYSPGKHHHLDMELEAGSVELIIDKT